MDQFPRGFSASDKFAVLPKAARPARKLYLTVYADGDLVIYPSGVMDVSSAAPLEAKSFTSLDGISFPAPPTTGTKLTLLNGWRSGQQFGTGNPAFWRKNGMVYLLGSLRARPASQATSSPCCHPVHARLACSISTSTATEVLSRASRSARTAP
jgi:hypothetical protein